MLPLNTCSSFSSERAPVRSDDKRIQTSRRGRGLLGAQRRDLRLRLSSCIHPNHLPAVGFPCRHAIRGPRPRSRYESSLCNKRHLLVGAKRNRKETRIALCTDRAAYIGGQGKRKGGYYNMMALVDSGCNPVSSSLLLL